MSLSIYLVGLAIDIATVTLVVAVLCDLLFRGGIEGTADAPRDRFWYDPSGSYSVRSQLPSFIEHLSTVAVLQNLHSGSKISRRIAGVALLPLC